MTTRSRVDALQRCVPRRRGDRIVVVYPPEESPVGVVPPTEAEIACASTIIRVVYDHAATAPGVG